MGPRPRYKHNLLADKLYGLTAAVSVIEEWWGFASRCNGLERPYLAGNRVFGELADWRALIPSQNPLRENKRAK